MSREVEAVNASARAAVAEMERRNQRALHSADAQFQMM